MLRQRAQQALARAESAEFEARRQFQSALYEEARALVLSQELGHRAKALEAIRQAQGATNQAELRRVAFAALGLADLRLERELPVPGTILAASISPSLEQVTFDGGRDPISVRSVPGMQRLTGLKPVPATEGYDVRWSDDSRCLAVKRQFDRLGARSFLEVWDLDRNQIRFTTTSDIPYSAFAFSPQLSSLLTGHTDGRLSLWDLKSGQERNAFNLPASPHALALSPQGDRLAVSYQRGANWVIAFHDTTSGALVDATVCPEPLMSIAWHPQSEWVTAGENPPKETQQQCGDEEPHSQPGVITLAPGSPA